MTHSSPAALSSIDRLFGDFAARDAFEPLPRHIVDRFRALARIRTCSDGELVHDRGTSDRTIFALARGTLIIRALCADGRDRPIHLIRAGRWLASPGLIADEPRAVSMVASGAVEIVYITGPALDQLFEEEPIIWRWVARLSAANTAVVLRIVQGLLVDGAMPRLCARLANMIAGDGTIELSQASLARLAGLSRNTVQRTLDRLERHGVVAAGYRRLTILDRRALEHIAAQGDLEGTAADGTLDGGGAGACPGASQP